MRATKQIKLIQSGNFQLLKQTHHNYGAPGIFQHQKCNLTIFPPTLEAAPRLTLDTELKLLIEAAELPGDLAFFAAPPVVPGFARPVD